MLGSIEQLAWDFSKIDLRSRCPRCPQVWTGLRPSWKTSASLLLMAQSAYGVLLNLRFSYTRAAGPDLSVPTEREVPSIPEN